MKSHPLLKVEEQIEHMRNNGVQFEIMHADEAADYLRRNNNYYRLRSYRHGFERVSDGPSKGRYVNLDFAMLVDLATIDMHLRYQIMPLSLEIEHFFKMRLLNSIEDHNEDGYGIVRDFLSSCERTDERGRPINIVYDEINRGKDDPTRTGSLDATGAPDTPFGHFSSSYPLVGSISSGSSVLVDMMTRT